MHLLKSILSLIWRGWFVLVAVLATFVFGVFFIFPFTFRKKDYSKAYYFLRIWAKTVFYGSGLTYKIHDFQDFEKLAPYIVISNHTSMMDIMLMFILNKKPMIFVGKKELLSIPVFGHIFCKLNIVVDRDDPKSRMKVFREAHRKLKEGKSICIFPEGGVPDEEVFLDEFLDGPFAISVMSKKPLVSFTFCGLKQILPYAYFRGHPGKVQVYLNGIALTEDSARKDIQPLKKRSYQEIYERLESCEENRRYS